MIPDPSGSRVWLASGRRRADRPRNNPAERALRSVAIGRKNYLSARSALGAERAAPFYTLIETAKLNGLDLEAYLRDVLTRLANHPAKRLAELLSWNWSPVAPGAQAA